MLSSQLFSYVVESVGIICNDVLKQRRTQHNNFITADQIVKNLVYFYLAFNQAMLGLSTKHRSSKTHETNAVPIGSIVTRSV